MVTKYVSVKSWCLGYLENNDLGAKMCTENEHNFLGMTPIHLQTNLISEQHAQPSIKCKIYGHKERVKH